MTCLRCGLSHDGIIALCAACLRATSGKHLEDQGTGKPSFSATRGRETLEGRLREASPTKQIVWTAGVAGLSVLTISTFNVAGVVVMAPLWRTTWRALTLLKQELDEEAPRKES
jgi:hypothetical protein